ncbi:hypothetical protein B0J14DRAFT_671693 [Halenospora varia]|nr:hypothetical protein B0J14DRAFT_671693 [Halenospora varia]
MAHRSQRMGHYPSSRNSSREIYSRNQLDLELVARLFQRNFSQQNKELERNFEELTKILREDIQKATANVPLNGQSPDVQSGGPLGLFSKFLGTSTTTNTKASDAPPHNNQERIDRQDENQWERTQLEMATMAENYHDLGLCARHLRDQVEELQKEKQAVKSREREFQIRLQEMTLREEELQKTITKLRADGEHMRNLFQKEVRGTGQIDDISLIRKFVRLRAQIQRIVNKYYPPNVPAEFLSSDISQKQSSFFKAWRIGVDGTQFSSQIRGMLFTLIDEKILSTKLFGLGETSDSWAMERRLAEFEEAIERDVKNEHRADIDEWRACTIRCASRLPQADDARHIAKKIHDKMLPLSIFTVANLEEKLRSSSKVDEYGKHMTKLCKDALELTLILRASKDRYEIVFPDDDTQLDRNVAEGQQLEQRNPTKDEMSPGELRIAYCLSGGLVRYPQVDPKNGLVLEKADVVVYNA